MNVHARRFPLFDSLRAVAAILVLGAHAAGPSHADAPGNFARPFATRLDVGVAIFFVISGFLLYRPFAHARIHGERHPDLRSYALGRFLRIVPAYWLALTVIALWLPRPLVFGEKSPVFYGFAQIYAGAPLGGISAAWSLCIEVAFYVFLPVFVLVLGVLPGRTPRARMRNAIAGLVVLAAAAIGYRGYVAAAGLVEGGNLSFPPLAFLDWFVLGMGLALLTIWLEDRDEVLPRWLRPLDRWPGLCWAAALAMFVAASLSLDGQIYNYDSSEFFVQHFAYGFIAIALALPLAVGDQTRGLLRRVLANRVLLYLGLVSYGIFLWHQAVLEQLENWGLGDVGFIHPYLLWPGVALALSTVIATVSYYALERPAMGLRRRILGPRADRPRGEALAEPAPATPLAVRD
jgi:peptidoglycan/LPS O-acetylase OafA/YrhL